MSTIITPKKGYKKAVSAEIARVARTERSVKRGLFSKKSPTEVKKFLDASFGIFKNSFGKQSSVDYINSLRKQWR